MTNLVCSYEIASGDAAWEDAEQQIHRSAVQANGEGRSTVVSVKSSQPVAKRKASEGVAEAANGAAKDKKKKKRKDKHSK